MYLADLVCIGILVNLVAEGLIIVVCFHFNRFLNKQWNLVKHLLKLLNNIITHIVLQVILCKTLLWLLLLVLLLDGVWGHLSPLRIIG